MRRLFGLLLVGTVGVIGCGEKAPAPPVQVPIGQKVTRDPPALPAEGTPTPPAAPPTTAPPMTPGNLAKAYTERTAAFHDAAAKGQLSLMLDLRKQGADVNDKDAAGRTALHAATAAGKRSAVLKLLALGADPLEADNDGQTALHVAADIGDASLIEAFTGSAVMLDEIGSVFGTAGDALKGTGLTADGVKNRLKAVQSLGAWPVDKAGQSPMHKAAAKGHLDAAKAIFRSSNQADRQFGSTEQDGQGNAPLLLAALNGHDSFVEKGAGFAGFAILDVKNRDGKCLADFATKPGPAGEAIRKMAALKRRYDIVNAARRNDLAAWTKLTAGVPLAELPARDMLFTAVDAGATDIVKACLALWKDQPTDAKSKLFGFPLSTGIRDGWSEEDSAFHRAAKADNLDTLKLLIDRDWWKDDATLAELMARGLEAGASRNSPPLAQMKERLATVYRARLAELAAAKK